MGLRAGYRDVTLRGEMLVLMTCVYVTGAFAIVAF